jgi:hypothetical protein
VQRRVQRERLAHREVGEEARVLLHVRQGHAVGGDAAPVVEVRAAVRDTPRERRVVAEQHVDPFGRQTLLNQFCRSAVQVDPLPVCESKLC